jgi:pimeloyl-ACP methyl ester carboxylesterase
MKTSESLYLDIRGRRMHVRRWGQARDPKLFLLHGIHDLSASWQFMVDALARPWQVFALDWRGFGGSDWGGGDTYWSPDYVADLSFLLDALSPDEPARVVAHSLGGSTMCVYAGVCPGRIARWVDIEGFGPGFGAPEDLPKHYAEWLAALRKPASARSFANLDELAARIRTESPGLTPERARFLAEAWAKLEPDGRVSRRSDPAHRNPRPTMWRFDEQKALWARHQAPLLFVEGGDSKHIAGFRGKFEGYEARLVALPTLQGPVVIPGAGHNVHHDQPERLAAAIEGFLAQP